MFFSNLETVSFLALVGVRGGVNQEEIFREKKKKNERPPYIRAVLCCELCQLLTNVQMITNEHVSEGSVGINARCDGLSLLVALGSGCFL